MKLFVVLLVLMVVLDAVRAVSLPVLYTKGSHYQIGHDIGHTFCHQIQEYFSLHPFLNSLLVPWANQPEGKAIVDGFLASLTGAFPWIVDEMKGIAEGANVTYNQVVLMNLNMELLALINSTATQDEPEPCTDIYINDPDSQQVLMGHNEDTSPLIKTRGFIVHVEVVKNIRGQLVTTQKFTAYSYPGVVPGNTFGFNQHGLVTTVNALYPKLVSKKKIGRYFLTRALLAAGSVEEAQHILETAGGYGAAYGFSVNMGVIKGKNLEIWNFENAPVVDKAKTATSAYQVPKAKWYFHVNKYRRITIDEIPQKIESSLHRTKRIKEFPQPTCDKDIRTMLGDTADKDFPIYRNPSNTDPGCTVATAVFDLLKCKLDIYLDNPKLTESVLTLSLPCQ